MNHRRKLVFALGVGAFNAQRVALAQQAGKSWRVGFMGFASRPAAIDAHVFGGFPRGMRELGDIEGKNFAIEWRFADGKRDRLPELAAELVRLKVDVIVASASAATIAAQSATSMIPIVFAAVNDPVSQGMVKSLLWRQPDRRFPSSGNLRGQDIQGRQTE